MESGGRHSSSPEAGSEGPPSAPSEVLAEFLSAIMRRQYAEALKYCRLILQYEPHNTTARGFYPLLQHKLLQEPAGEEAGSSADERSDSPAGSGRRAAQTADSSEEARSVGSQSSLELDSEPSLELSRRTDSAGGSACWESSGSASRSDADDNGNPPPAPPPAARAPRSPAPGDVENDNATASGEPHPADCLKNESLASLRRLRAQFACSIK